jgi:arylsulfatase A-like enzyme
MRAIIVLFDSLNRAYLPCYGNKRTIAPNFERLSRRAVTFDASFVGSMPCIPARRELHTGRYNFLHREWGPLEPFDDSMPSLLKAAGTYTHLISDHLHYWEDGGATYHTRYSSWEIVRGQEGDHWKGEVREPEIPEVVRVPTKQGGHGTSSLWRYDWVNRKYIHSEADYPQTKVFNLAQDFIETNAGEDNWLLQIETFDPHEPFMVDDKYLRPYKSDYDGPHYDWPRGKVQESPNEIEHVRDQYSALVSMCDHSLGRVLDLMDRHDMWKDTLLIVGTDHGFLLSEHGYWGKNLMPYYNEVANTPLFVWDPRYQKQNERRTSLVQLVDWAPTLLDFFGVAAPRDMQGKNLAPVLADDRPVREACLYGVFGGHVNVTDGRYAYMRAPLEEKREVLYNYTLQPMQMTGFLDCERLAAAELHPGYSFTKGCSVLKIPARDKYKVYTFGNLLFDLEADPGQQTPIADPAIERRMLDLMRTLMAENEAPSEQYERLAL